MFGALVRLQSYLSIDTTRTNERRIQRLDSVRRHDDLHLSACIESIELVEQLKHGALNLSLAAAAAIISLGSHRIDLVDEHDGGRMLVRNAEQLAHQLRTVAQVLLDQLRADDAKESGGRLVRDGLGQKSLA